MKARVFITLKRGILDPQGQAVLHAIEALGQTGVKEARIGKFIELAGGPDALIVDVPPRHN